MSDKHAPEELSLAAFLSQLNLMDVALFEEVARQHSLSKAAETLDSMTESTASRRLKRLEELLASRLIDRTSRTLTLTDCGETYLQQVDTVLAAIRELHRMSCEVRNQTCGTLKVGAGLYVAEFLGQEFLGQFVQQHPEITLDFKLIMTPEKLESALQERDVIISSILPAEKNLGLVKLRPLRMEFFASHDYLARHGRPSHPQELANHRILTVSSFLEVWQQALPWSDASGEVHWVPIKHYVSCATVSALVNMVGQGAGVLLAPQVLVDRVQDQLELLFDGQYNCTLDVYAILPSTRLMPKKVALFLDELEIYIRRFISEYPNGSAQR